MVKRLKWRYAVKRFDSNKILSPKKVDDLKEAFNLTATSYGLQPIRLAVVHNKELQEKLVAFSYGQKQVAQASHILVICVERQVDANYITTYFNRVRDTRNTPEEILDPFKQNLIKEFSEKSQDEIRAWAVNQAYLALGNLLTFCAAEEIDACPMEGFDAKAYDEALGLNAMGLESVLLLPVGHRAEDDPFSSFKKVRRPITESIIEIK